MTTAIEKSTSDTSGNLAAVAAACSRIAPTWPLDRMIAVNPLWGRTSAPLPEVAGELATLAGSRLVMPRAWYREQWEAGAVSREHLVSAIEESGATATPDQLVAALNEAQPSAMPLPLYSDAVDATTDGVHQMSWHDFVLQNISQLCASYFDEGQAQIQPDREGGLYAMWRRYVAKDMSPRFLMKLSGYRDAVRDLPEDAGATIDVILDELEVPLSLRESYLSALLYSVNGWASWCAYLRWQAGLAGGGDDHIVELLAIRLAWDWLLYRCAETSDVPPRWQGELARWEQALPAARNAQGPDWLWQRAVEIAYQAPLCAGLAAAAAPAQAPVSVQAAFCIDVRSEVFRRALEAQSAGIKTLGFAGFFGLPIDYLQLGADEARPQLPGLLAPALRVADTCGDATGSAALPAKRHARLGKQNRLKQFKTGSLSTFSFVETGGPLYALKLAAQSLGFGRPESTAAQAGLSEAEQQSVRPRLVSDVGGAEVADAERIKLAAGVLGAMSLTGDFAPLVLLAGHGSETVNNPHAAGLDCGACCGQTGEVNARALADLLNDATVRAGLAGEGIVIPDGTHFLPGMHNTTTDEVALFDLDQVPAALADEMAELQEWLDAAATRARRERAGRLGLAGLGDSELAAAVDSRARDWSEVRPEWALANNAAFVVAPRARTAAMNLEGRSFLHDYQWQDDDGFGVLELIMTAPMVVTHWINMQYYTSTVDNQRFGSGNKVLHNVVGARVGVFEGNGGDLRIGLPMQSLHDGEQWMHTPLRLSVFIEAPRAPIDDIIAKHETVRHLVDNGWLYLFRIDSETGAVEARVNGEWSARS